MVYTGVGPGHAVDSVRLQRSSRDETGTDRDSEAAGKSQTEPYEPWISVRLIPRWHAGAHHGKVRVLKDGQILFDEDPAVIRETHSGDSGRRLALARVLRGAGRWSRHSNDWLAGPRVERSHT